MRDSDEGGGGTRGAGRRRGTPLMRLPIWSRLLIATRQRSPSSVGGDFFEVVQHRDGHVTTFLADVCGDGAPASVPVRAMRWALLQRLARAESPALLLSALNDWLLRQQSEALFVTALAIRIDPLTGAGTAAGAGHLGPFVKRAAGTTEALPLDVGPALGIAPDQYYAELSVALAPEDTVVLCTDGITDGMATGDDPLGERGLIAKLGGTGAGAERICTALLGPEAEPVHDETVIVIQLPRRKRRR